MNPTISSVPVPLPWREMVRSTGEPLVDYETGGPALAVGSDSHAFQWVAHSDGTSVWVSREGVAPALLLTDTGITEIALAFDQTMNPHIAYVASGVAKWFYWDTLASAYDTMTLTTARSPRCCSDEKTPQFSGDRDVVLAYMKGDGLFLRLQRDRFTVEYEKEPDPDNHAPFTESTRLTILGMNTGNRLQFRFQ